MIPSISFAEMVTTSITLDPGGSVVGYPIPARTTVSLYAKGGDGATGYWLEGAGGGGGACAYSSTAGYILCVGGGGGGYGGGGAGGSTAGDGVGRGGKYVGWSGILKGFDGTKNGAGGAGGAHPPVGMVSGAGGAPGYGGGVGYAGGGGALFRPGAALYGGYYLNLFGAYLMPSGTYLGGGNGCWYGAGGGGGYGGGGGGGGYIALGNYGPQISSGGGGSSYFHPSLSGPDSDGYVSIPVSVTGSQISLYTGLGGINNCYYQFGGTSGTGGTITLKYSCDSTFGTSCTKSANSCGVSGYATSDWGTVNCDGSCSVSGVSAELPYWNQSCTSYPNACGQTTSGTYDCSGVCNASPPPDLAGFNTECSGGTNSCGDSNPGYFVCSGTGVACSASGPPAQRSYYGATCTLTSAPNACGQTTTVSTAGSYDCNYTCTGTPPAPPSNAACAPTTPTISGLYQSGVNLGPSAPAYDPSGYQIYANATSPAGYDLTYYFEFSTDGINWSGDPAPAQWATLP